MKANLIDYVDFKSITEDLDLNHGDISPYQTVKLEELLKQFIDQNSEGFIK